jgi:chromosome segregation ATPase
MTNSEKKELIELFAEITNKNTQQINIKQIINYVIAFMAFVASVVVIPIVQNASQSIEKNTTLSTENKNSIASISKTINAIADDVSEIKNTRYTMSDHQRNMVPIDMRITNNDNELDYLSKELKEQNEDIISIFRELAENKSVIIDLKKDLEELNEKMK